MTADQRPPKASDIPDAVILGLVAELDRGIGASSWDIAERLPEFPEKVVRAKLAALRRRGRIDGSARSGRGDWTLMQQAGG